MLALLVSAVALLVGLAVLGLTRWMGEHGPMWGGISLRGNGATIFLLPAGVFLLWAERTCARRGARWGAVLVPIALGRGLFVLLGGM